MTRPGRVPHAGDAAMAAVLTLVHEGNTDAAIAALEALLATAPRHGAARNALGVLLLERGRVPEARAVLEALARDAPEAPAALVNVGNARLADGAVDEALGAFEQAARLDPAHAGTWYGLGRARQLAGDPHGAAEAYARTLRLEPGHVPARASRAVALSFTDRFVEAEQEAREAIRCAPGDAGAHLNLGIALLSQGRWAEGWEAFEWRRRSGVLAASPAPFASPVWDGVPRPGTTLVVHAEQGLGDTLQFVRYLPRLRALGMRVVLVVQRSLVRLLHGAGATPLGASLADLVLPIGARVPPHDAHVSLSSLAHRLRCHTDAAVCGNDRPYLRPVADAEPWSPASGRPLRVGLVWAGSVTHVNDRHRSPGLDAVRPLLDDARVSWVCLQADASPAALEGLPFARRLEAARDFVDTARLLAETDLLVTPDTAMAHLAGALGHPAWVLLPRIGLDWRWTVGGVPDGWARTPWYASVTLLRQREGRDWSATIGEVGRALSALHRGTPPPAVSPVR
jgi:Flp pilus assembly protein TadD